MGSMVMCNKVEGNGAAMKYPKLQFLFVNGHHYKLLRYTPPQTQAIVTLHTYSLPDPAQQSLL